MVWLPMFAISDVLTDVEACDYTRGLYGHLKLRESAPEVDSGRKIACRTGGLEPASVLRLV